MENARGAAVTTKQDPSAYQAAYYRRRRAQWRAQGLNSDGKPYKRKRLLPEGLYKDHTAYMRAWRALKQQTIETV